MSDRTILYVLYECGICGFMHPWDFMGDCRDEDAVEVRSMGERVAVDEGHRYGSKAFAKRVTELDGAKKDD